MRTVIALAAAASALFAVGCQDAASPVDRATAIRPAFDNNGDDNGDDGGDFQCTGTASGSYDNVIVPPGATCTLAGATVKGNVKALENSRLTINGTTVGGNVDGDKADQVQLFQVSGGSRNRVGGNIQIKEGDVGARVSDTDLPGGNIQIEKMRGDIRVGNCNEPDGNTLPKGNIKVEDNFIPAGSSLQICGNTVGGNLQVFKNSGTGQKTVRNNTVRQDLQCKENATPFVGSPNTAGKKEGQCRP